MNGRLRGLLGTAAIYSGANVIARAVAFLLLPLYARALSPVELGMLELVVSLGAILNLLLPLEISVAYGRFAADTPRGSDAYGRLLATTWTSLLITSTLGMLGLALIPRGHWISVETARLFDSLGALPMILWMLVILNYMVSNQLRWLERPKAFSTLALITAAITLATGYALVRCAGFRLSGALAATCCGLLASSVVGAWLIRHDFGQRPSFHLWRRMMAFALPLWLGNLLLVGAQQADRFLLAAWFGLDQLGQYSIALRFASIASIAVGGLQMALVPMIFSDPARMRPLLAKILALYGLGTAALVTVLSALSNEIVTVVASARFTDTAPLIAVMTFTTMLHGAYVFFPGLWLEMRSRRIASISAAYAASVVFFSIVGASLAGIPGVVFGQLAASALYVALNARASSRTYAYAPHAVSLAAAAACAFFMISVGFASAPLPLRAWLMAAILLILGTSAVALTKGQIGGTARSSGRQHI